jgi:hypothetical protein
LIPVSGLRRAIDGARRAASEMNAVDLALRLTLLDLLLHPIGAWTLRPLILASAAAGLLLPGVLRTPGLWWLLTLLTGLRAVLDWPLADNHAYLLCYWCLAISLSLIVEDTAEFLAHNGRWLIGLAFAFATLWKGILSPDYTDGTFFRVTLLSDPRFEDLCRLLGGLSPDAIASFREALERHADGGMLAAAGPLEPARFRWLARAVTIWTLVIEGVLAVAFLWPRDKGPSRLRDACLLLFCATTYAVATVEGFGWLLISMGIAQCAPGRRTTRALYLAAFALILFYREVPWTSLVADRFAPA